MLEQGDVEQKKYSSTAGGSANLYFGNQCGGFSGKIYLKAQVAISFQVIYPDVPPYQKDICSTEFIVHNSQTGNNLDASQLKNHPDQGNPDPERQLLYVLTCKWTLALSKG